MSASLLRPLRITAIAMIVFFVGWGIYSLVSWRFMKERRHRRVQKRIQTALQKPLDQGTFPRLLEFEREGGAFKSRATYTIDATLQTKMEKLIRLWRPDYASFVALDPDTGAVITIVSYSKREPDIGALATRSTFPAASVFKLVAATAGIDEKIVTPNSRFSYNGKSHTLYKRHITSQKVNRWTRSVSLKRAFALSINPVFGKMGMFQLQGKTLQKYANRFYFNREIPSDLPIGTASFSLKDNNPWAWAEIASGFNRVVLMSPIQGAMMAASVINGGVMMEPYVVKSLHAVDATSASEPIYQVSEAIAETPMSEVTAQSMQELMHETVRRGTAGFAFRRPLRRRLKGVMVGGKTGSLKGADPAGRCDWFVGYGQKGEKKVAFAALTVDVEKWRVKSATLAAEFLQAYFKDR